MFGGIYRYKARIFFIYLEGEREKESKQNLAIFLFKIKSFYSHTYFLIPCNVHFGGRGGGIASINHSPSDTFLDITLASIVSF